MKQSMIQKASNNIEFRDKADAFEILKTLYGGEQRYNQMKRLIHECLFLSHERRFTKEEKDCFESLAKNISDYIKDNKFKEVDLYDNK